MIEERFVLFRLFGFIPFSVVSIVDIGIVAFMLERLFVLIRGTRSAQVLMGLLIVVAVSAAAPLLQLDALAWLLAQLRSILLILLVVLFQPELRRMLLDLGRNPLLGRFLRMEPSRALDAVADGAEDLAARGHGALVRGLQGKELRQRLAAAMASGSGTAARAAAAPVRRGSPAERPGAGP